MNDKAKDLHSLRIDRSAAAEPSPWTLRPQALVLAAVLFLAFAAFIAERAGLFDASQPQAASTPVQTAAAAPAAPAPQAAVPSGGLVASGYIVARRVATVSAEITGRITEVLVEEGMTVQKGQILARLDSSLVDQDLPSARAQIVSSTADLAATDANLADAVRILDRIRPLAKTSARSDADLTSAEAKVAELRAQHEHNVAAIEIAKLSLKRTEEQLAKYEIHAPFTGVVTEKSAQMGEIVSPLSTGGFTRTGICTIVDMDSLEIEVDVNEANIGRVGPNQSVDAFLDAYPDWKIPASVIAVIPTANRDKAAIKVRIRLLVKDPRILPNMAVKTTFIEKPQGKTG